MSRAIYICTYLFVKRCQFYHSLGCTVARTAINARILKHAQRYTRLVHSLEYNAFTPELASWYLFTHLSTMRSLLSSHPGTPVYHFHSA